jgi:hypothetical protein
MTRIRVPNGLSVPPAVYRVEADANDGHWYGATEAGGRVDLTTIWEELRGSPGVEIECSRHPGSWWPTAGKEVPLAGLDTWRCPTCAWAFRQGLEGRGGTPQF